MIPKDSQALSLWTCVFIMLQEKKGIKVVHMIRVTNQVTLRWRISLNYLDGPSLMT